MGEITALSIGQMNKVLQLSRIDLDIFWFGLDAGEDARNESIIVTSSDPRPDDASEF